MLLGIKLTRNSRLADLLGRDSPEAASVPFERVPGRPFAFPATASDNLSVAALQPEGCVVSRSAPNSKLRAEATGVMADLIWRSVGGGVLRGFRYWWNCRSRGRSVAVRFLRSARMRWYRRGNSVDRDNLLKMAQSPPAQNYSFKPTPEIKTFGDRPAIWPAQICSFGGESWHNKRCLALVRQRFPNRN